MPNIFNETHDVVIVGGGPGGTACALSLLEKGIRPLIIEKESFPRFHIGESLTAEMGKRLREFGFESYMRDEQQFPVKRGVKVWGKEGRNDFYIPVKIADDQNKLQDSTTWQVRRDDFDLGMLEFAKERGAIHIKGLAKAPIGENGRLTGVKVELPDGQIRDICSRMVVDASGQSTFLASKSNLTSKPVRGRYDRQIAIFSQIKGAKRGGDIPADDTIIFYREKFHWAWFIPLTEDIVSIGVVVPANFFRERNQSKEAFYKEELFALNPRQTERLENIEIVKEVHTASNYSYHVDQFVGNGFLCIGDAHRFVDPIFSFGLHFAFHEGIFASQAIADYFDCGLNDLAPLLAYQQKANQGQDIIQDFIDCFWDYPAAFVIMAHFQFREQFINLFSGRVYDNAQEMAAVKKLRKFLRKK
jgi:flavin-dependent dehydrogenase